MNEIIKLIHIILFLLLLVTPIIDNYDYKRFALIILVFILFHYLSGYGKCGLINIEKFFLKENFKNGVVFKIIKPVISNKNNLFYNKLFWLLLIYIFIIYYQLNEKHEGITTVLINYLYSKK